MAQPVWVLSVDLQTKTATFQTGLADAAKAARGTFNDIKGGAGEMGGAVNHSMMEARFGVMALGEEFGVHLPRALTTFIAGLGPVGPALEAAFPFLAVALGATLLIEHLVKMHQAGEKLTEDQLRFGTTAQNAFNSMDQKILQAQIRADDLRNNHLGALRHELELIDKQSLAELVHQFTELAKGADAVFAGLKTSWYEFGAGSEGAKHALSGFQAQYEFLLSKGKDKEASDLLRGTRESAEKTLSTLHQSLAESQALQSAIPSGAPGQEGMVLAAANALHAAKLKSVQDEVSAQEQLLAILNDQGNMEQRVADLKKLDKDNATHSEANRGSAQAASAAREAAESQLRMGEQSLAADKASAEAVLAVHRVSLESRLAVDLEFAARERDIQLAANAAEVTGLDKSGKDYSNQLKALKDKALEITNEYAAKTAEMTAKSSIEVSNRDLQALEQGEREKIAATQQGSAARLAAIDGALRQEQAANLEDTNFFRELLNQRVETARQEAEEEGKLRAEAAKESADSSEKLGALSVAAERQRFALEDSVHRESVERQIAQEAQLTNAEYALKMAALEREISGLDKFGKDYLNKLKQLQDQEKQVTQQHENELVAIREKAEIETNNKLSASYQQFTSTVAGELSKTIMGHQSMARMIGSLGDEMISGLIKNAIEYAMSNKFRQESDAKAAASAGFKLGMEIGGPAGPVLAPIFATAAFAGALAFESGGIVPGFGGIDSVPTMLTPGEAILPKALTDGLMGAARSGTMSGGPTYHVHVRPTYHVNTIDGDGMQAALEKHTDQLTKHFEHTLRRMNH